MNHPQDDAAQPGDPLLQAMETEWGGKPGTSRAQQQRSRML